MNVAERMSSTAPYRTQSGLTPYTGPWTQAELVHLLRRTMFGVKGSDLSYFTGRSMNQVVDELLTPTAAAPALPIKEYSIAATPGVNPDANIAQGTTWVNDINNDGTVQSFRRSSIKKWLTGNMINQDRSVCWRK